MKRALLVLVGMLLGVPSVNAGCIGPEIMGVCQGQEVPYDTHPDGQIRQDAPPGFFYDKRGTRDEERYPGSVNPFTGKDANDSSWMNQQQPQRPRGFSWQKFSR